MTDQERLERAYRRLLAWYPRAFRRENGPEILAVLMASARDGKRRPGLAESADLIRCGLWMRLRPGVPGSAPTVRAAVRFMYAGAMVSTVNLIILLALTVDIKAYHAVLGYHLTAAQVSQFNTLNATNPLGRSGIGLAIVSCVVQPALWLWMARANGQGGDWARRMSTQWFCLATLSLASVFPQSPLPRYVPAVHLSFVPLLGPIVLVLTWLPGAAAVCLLWLPASTAYFRPDSRMRSAEAPAPGADGRTRAAPILQSTGTAPGMSRVYLRACGHRAAGRRGGPAAGSRRRRVDAAEYGRGMAT